MVDKNGDTTINGDPTEAAFLVLGAKKGVTREDVENDIIDGLPFSSERKFRASLFKNGTDKFICLIGAPEVIIEKCNRIYHRGEEQNLDKIYRLEIQEKIASWSNEAKRVFAIGFFNNRYINYAVGFSTIVLVGLIYIPVLASIFRFEALSLMEFGILLFASSSVLRATEIYKFMHKIKNTH
jgi:magnesium-transporting ATPase (P-type)